MYLLSFECLNCADFLFLGAKLNPQSGYTSPVIVRAFTPSFALDVQTIATLAMAGLFILNPKRGMMAAVETRENATKLAERDGGWFCHYCGVLVGCIEDLGTRHTANNKSWYSFNESRSPVKVFSIDHKIPKTKGGSDDLDNLLLTCRKCNQRKGKKDYDEFIEWLKRERF